MPWRECRSERTSKHISLQSCIFASIREACSTRSLVPNRETSSHAKKARRAHKNALTARAQWNVIEPRLRQPRAHTSNAANRPGRIGRRSKPCCAVDTAAARSIRRRLHHVHAAPKYPARSVIANRSVAQAHGTRAANWVAYPTDCDPEQAATAERHALVQRYALEPPRLQPAAASVTKATKSRRERLRTMPQYRYQRQRAHPAPPRHSRT